MKSVTGSSGLPKSKCTAVALQSGSLEQVHRRAGWRATYLIMSEKMFSKIVASDNLDMFAVLEETFVYYQHVSVHQWFLEDSRAIKIEMSLGITGCITSKQWKELVISRSSELES